MEKSLISNQLVDGIPILRVTLLTGAVGITTLVELLNGVYWSDPNIPENPSGVSPRP